MKHVSIAPWIFWQCPLNTATTFLSQLNASWCVCVSLAQSPGTFYPFRRSSTGARLPLWWTRELCFRWGDWCNVRYCMKCGVHCLLTANISRYILVWTMHTTPDTCVVDSEHKQPYTLYIHMYVQACFHSSTGSHRHSLYTKAMYSRHILTKL